jgi:hypothetical protein
MNRRFWIIEKILYGLFFIFLGCTTYEITQNKNLAGGYSKGEIFVAQKDLVLDKSGILVDNDLVVQGVKESEKPRWVKDIFLKGERLKIVSILFKKHPDIGDSIHPIGIILDGKLKGEEVDLYLISKIYKHVITEKSRFVVLTNDPNRLKRAF